MALFGSYAPPGVYTTVVIQGAGQPLFGNARIPVIIGEGQEFFEQDNVELFRGSSAVAQPQAVNENISDQVTEITNQLHTTYFPVVVGGNGGTTGSGTAVVTNNPAYIQVTVNGIPATVITLNGQTGSFMTQELVTPGDNVEITYYFLRADTLITNEDESDQVPRFGSLTVSDSSGSATTISVTIPGAIDNAITIALTDDSLSSPPGGGVVDALAVSGAGTDAISVDIRKTAANGGGVRSVEDLYNLIQAGIPTLDAGYLTATLPTPASPPLSPPSPGNLSVMSATALSGGAGPNSNTTFQVEFVPIVDGTNGGVVTTDITKIKVLVNGSPATVQSLNGAAGQFTMAQPVASGSTLVVTYYTNTYQNTYDLLPAANVASIIEVGLGPNRSDFIQDTDYVLGQDVNGNGTINWGAFDTVVSGINTSGFTPFGPTEITTTLVDDKVYLRPCTGTANGKNLTFTLEDVPVDGSGRSVPTGNPNLISVYVGPDPAAAFDNGAVRVITLDGANGVFTLFNAPASGQNVYASYYRNTLNDHSYTVTVVQPGIPGQGTYTINDEVNRILPVVSNGTDSVMDPNFVSTGIVWPSDFSDLYDEPGAVDETVTATFEDDALALTITNATQAILSTQGITFVAQTPGIAGNNISIAFDTTTVGNPSVAGNVITIHGALTISQVVGLFPVYVPAQGTYVNASGSGSTLVSTASALNLSGGTAGVSIPIANRFTVTSTAANGSSGTGYLGQTYIDENTGLRFTIVAPSNALNYGYTTLPSPQYFYAPGDTLQFVVSKETARYSGSVYFPFSTAQPNNLICIEGLRTKVATTFGANFGDTAIIQTFNKSGNEPSIGEFYFVSFTTNKTAADYAIQLYTTASSAYAAYGQPTTINRVSLGVQLMTQNGAQQFGVIQVPKQPGLGVASDADFISAIQSLTVALPGLTQKANVIVPLSTSTTVQQFLSRQLITQATVRNKGEAIGFIGYNSLITPAQAMQNANSLKNSRMIAIGNPVAGINITDPTTGLAIEYAVSGEFMAAALAGLNINPSNDVATTLTNQNLVGFTRLLVKYDDTTMNQMASAGLTLLTDNSGALNVRDYLSTDPSNPITYYPTNTTITDYVAQQFRKDLQQFIGRKMVDGLTTDIAVVCNSRLVSLYNNQIIAAYNNLSVVPDPTDPTTVDVTVSFKPLFSLLYISVTFTVTLNP